MASGHFIYKDGKGAASWRSMKSLVREEERWIGKKVPGSYGRAFKRKYPNRHYSEKKPGEIGTD